MPQPPEDDAERRARTTFQNWTHHFDIGTHAPRLVKARTGGLRRVLCSAFSKAPWPPSDDRPLQAPSVTCTTARTSPRRPPSAPCFKTSWAGRASGGRLPTRCRTPANGGASPVRRLRRRKSAEMHGRRSRLVETKLLGNNTTLERRGRGRHPKARPGISSVHTGRPTSNAPSMQSPLTNMPSATNF